MQFVELEEVKLLIKAGKLDTAILVLEAFDGILAAYANTVDITVANQQEATDMLRSAYREADKRVKMAEPQRTGESVAPRNQWLKHFNNMCNELKTSEFSDVANGKVYLEEGYIMFKANTLTEYMLPHYGSVGKKFHLDTVRLLLRASSASVARQGVRARVWVVKMEKFKDAMDKA